MTTSRLLLAAVLLAAIAACKIGGDEIHTGAGAACVQVSGACTQPSDCCSYGCVSGVCVANPVEGGSCRTTNDCAGLRLCKSGACTTATVSMCRDEADVCSSYAQCCTGNCEGGFCTQNRPPVANAGPADVPNISYTQPYTLTNGSMDPDGDPLSYGWAFVTRPVGSVATLSSTTAATPSFTPDKTGDYVVRLVVTDGPTGAPNRYTVETSVTIHVVNREPQPTATATGARCQTVAGQLSCSRKNVIRISGTASDPDADALECAWRVTEPGATTPTELATFASCLNPSSAFIDYTPPGEGTYVVEYVVRDHDRTTNAIVHTVAAGATFVSHNDPPVPAVSRSPYYGNMGATPAATPAVVLDASSSTDPNSDSPLSYFWEMVSATNGAALPAISGFDTATPSFVPTAEADYVLKLTVSDPALGTRPAASDWTLVTVKVGRYVQPLAHGVIDVARAATARTKGILVMGGKDPSDATNTKGMLWIYDLDTGQEDATGIPLDAAGASGVPTLIDVTPDGTRAIVVDDVVSIWIVNLGARTMVRLTRPYAIGDVVVAGNRYAYLFGTPGSSSTVREVDLQNGTISATAPGWSGYGAFGTAYSAGTTTYVYRADDVFHYWERYSVNNSGAGTTPLAYPSLPTCGAAYPAQYPTAMWVTQNSTFANAYVIDSCGDVFRADTLASLSTSLGFSPTHVDSTSTGLVLASTGSALAWYNAALQAFGSQALPTWAQNGYGRGTWASKAFFDAAGAKRIAIVHDTATPVRYGVVTFSP